MFVAFAFRPKRGRQLPRNQPSTLLTNTRPIAEKYACQPLCVCAPKKMRTLTFCSRRNEHKRTKKSAFPYGGWWRLWRPVKVERNVDLESLRRRSWKTSRRSRERFNRKRLGNKSKILIEGSCTLNHVTKGGKNKRKHCLNIHLFIIRVVNYHQPNSGAKGKRSDEIGARKKAIG